MRACYPSRPATTPGARAPKLSVARPASCRHGPGYDALAAARAARRAAARRGSRRPARGRARAGRRPPSGRAQARRRAADAAVVRESLDRLHDQMRDMAQHGVSWQSQLKQQVDDVRHSTDALRRETAALSTALRKPQVRGRWGELHLRRVVELAGLVDRCDFAEQVTAREPTTRLLRPDLVVHLAGGKHVVVDAKVPLDAFLDATGDRRPTTRARRPPGPARPPAARSTSTRWPARPTGARCPRPRSSWCCSCPGESFLSAALEAEPTLLEYAADRQVVLATPDHADRAAAHRRLRLDPADAGRQGPRDPRARPRPARAARHDGRPPRPARPLARRGGRAPTTGPSARWRTACWSRPAGSATSASAGDDLDAPGGRWSTRPRPLTAAELLDAVAEPRPELPGPRRRARRPAACPFGASRR